MDLCWVNEVPSGVWEMFATARSVKNSESLSGEEFRHFFVQGPRFFKEEFRGAQWDPRRNLWWGRFLRSPYIVMVWVGTPPPRRYLERTA